MNQSEFEKTDGRGHSQTQQGLVNLGFKTRHWWRESAASFSTSVVSLAGGFQVPKIIFAVRAVFEVSGMVLTSLERLVLI